MFYTVNLLLFEIGKYGEINFIRIINFFLNELNKRTLTKPTTSLVIRLYNSGKSQRGFSMVIKQNEQ